MSQRRGQDFPDCHEEKISQRGARTDSDLESPDAGGVLCDADSEINFQKRNELCFVKWGFSFAVCVSMAV